MKKYEVKKQEQLQLFEKGDSFNQPAKRINIVSLKLVRESSILYKERRITSCPLQKVNPRLNRPNYIG
ncbi:hypothetical protein JNUCC23_21015 [Peribacillus sp. JNUCC 23]